MGHFRSDWLDLLFWKWIEHFTFFLILFKETEETQMIEICGQHIWRRFYFKFFTFRPDASYHDSLQWLSWIVQKKFPYDKSNENSKERSNLWIR